MSIGTFDDNLYMYKDTFNVLVLKISEIIEGWFREIIGLFVSTGKLTEIIAQD